MSTPKLIAFSGSSRRGSFNTSLAKAAAEAASASGASVEFVDLADYSIPLFNEDLEAESGLPEGVKTLKSKFIAADGFIIASPEYNSAFSPLMKNTIDWCSRAESSDEPPLAAYSGKSALLLAASPGALGGLRGLYAMRTLLQNISITVYAEMLAVRSAHEVFSETGEVKDERWGGKISKLTSSYVDFAGKLT
ncbi:MAG: NAD(P)H-dependent oxidoreductase [Verrucomicrobiales bacterium]|nr:NAD(P)H-dependent oxidoreductase [Verrucomicrobiales bacterium]